MYKKSTLFAVCLLTILPAFASQADPVLALNDLMTKLSTLQADFHLQIRNQESNELLDENSGTIILKRPGYFHVHTKEPFEEYIISNRQTLWTYDVELEQATREPVDERLQQTPFLLLSGDVEAIRNNFSVAEPEINSQAQTFTLSPNDPNASYDNVELQFNPDGVLTRMSWRNSLGERNTIDFSNIEVNKAIDNSQFDFQPPQGVMVESKTPNPAPLP